MLQRSEAIWKTYKRISGATSHEALAAITTRVISMEGCSSRCPRAIKTCAYSEAPTDLFPSGTKCPSSGQKDTHRTQHARNTCRRAGVTRKQADPGCRYTATHNARREEGTCAISLRSQGAAKPFTTRHAHDVVAYDICG